MHRRPKALYAVGLVSLLNISQDDIYIKCHSVFAKHYKLGTCTLLPEWSKARCEETEDGD